MPTARREAGQKILRTASWMEPACPIGGRQEQTPGGLPQSMKSLYDHPTVQRVYQRVRFSQRLSGKKVLLLMDNASVHRIDDAQIKRLKVTQIAFFPANTTSQLQPMDAGIIQAFKLYYRQSLHSHIVHKVKADITCNPLKDVTIALAIVWVFRAWCKVKAVNTIQLYAMARGDEQVLSSPVDLNHYQEIVASRRLAEQEQTRITD